MTTSREPLVAGDSKKTSSDRDIKRVLQPPQAYLPKVPPIYLNLITQFLNLEKDHKTLAGLSGSCSQLSSIYRPALTRQNRQKFLQPVVDNDIETVKQILNAKPALLLDKLEEDLVIDSKDTLEKLNLKGENALTIAAKRRQIEMLKILMPYVDKFQDQKLIGNIKADVLSKWPSYEHKEKKDKWNIPVHYIVELEKIIEIFKNETFPNGTEAKAKLSEKTELALEQFIDKILPAKAVTLDESIQPELFLYAAYKVHYNHYHDVNFNFDKLAAYCRRIIGLLQSRLTRKDKESWVGLKIEHLYRKERLDLSGIGGQYFGGSDGQPLSDGYCLSSTGKGMDWLEKIMSGKNRDFEKLMRGPGNRLRFEGCLVM
jgi:hypothetical protein